VHVQDGTWIDSANFVRHRPPELPANHLRQRFFGQDEQDKTVFVFPIILSSLSILSKKFQTRDRSDDDLVVSAHIIRVYLRPSAVPMDNPG